MKILFDNRMNNWSGIGRYSSNLINQFKEYNNLKPKISLLSNENKNEDLCFEKIKINSKVFSLKEQIEIPYLAKNKYDIYHSPHFVFPVMGKTNLILTIHDLTPLLFPDYFSIVARTYMKVMIHIAKLKARKIITVSNNTKNDLIRLFNISPQKIKVIYNGVKHKKKCNNKGKIGKIKKKFKIKYPYILYVGNVKPHKNIVRLIKAFKIINKNYNKINLVIVGSRDNSYKELIHTISNFPRKDNLILTGFVSDSELENLYSNAELFVYPSLYEGFGLPPLEAMTRGTPVITSNLSSLPEVVGDAAIKVNPYDIDELANTIEMALFDNVLRKKLIKRG
ncbi:MAG: glycosyltransferase family 4 protein, partial [archaeon]